MNAPLHTVAERDLERGHAEVLPEDEHINHLPPGDPRRTRARRRMALRTLFFAGSIMAVALLLVRGIVDGVEQRFFNAFSVLRIQDAARHLDAALVAPVDAAHPQKTVYVFGSSLIEFGFSPEIFDAELQAKGLATRAYNFGYGNADPSIHRMFATKFARTFARRHGKVDLTVFEFTPFQATARRARQTGQLNDAVASVLYDWQDFAQLAKTNHEKAVSLLNTRYFRNGVPAEAVTNLLGELTHVALNPGRPVDDGIATPLKDQAFHLYDMLLRQWPQANPPGGWYVQNRGGLPPTASPEALQLADQVMARLEVPARMAASHRQRLQCCDIEDLQFSKPMLDDFIAAVKEAQKVSKRVDVLLMPRNQDVVHLTATGRANLRAAMARIQRETGARVVDFSEAPRYGVDQFLDADHLTLFRGRERFSRQLADYYARDPLLQAQAEQQGRAGKVSRPRLAALSLRALAPVPEVRDLTSSL